ncbi:Wadjet anti-phage system protein JetD domain-containing protein [Endozoicomonas elysicola]|uniref:Wadjet anti-phage system protein JetD domain-containing protein n=1 Tax=Endozoicomonas elysicola TaxID=305900 RepID=UPI00037DD793|nr:Wadjet anti-phage system protein JetD domain-containing protein [Endozoicomonas elysicola]
MFSPEDAVPIALALLGEGYVQKGQQMPVFLDFLINARWVEKHSYRQRNNHFALRTTDDRQNFLVYMNKHFGDNWQTSLEKGETRDEFLSKRLLSPIPVNIHSRVQNAIWGEHSKKKLSAQPDIETVDSELIQLRTRMDCQLHFSGRVINCKDEMAFSDAIIINETALSKLQSIQCEAPINIITVENAGAWQHLPLPENVIALFVPGNNQKLALKLLSFFLNYQWAHFGDLDQKGLDIAAALARAQNRPLKLLIPDWWSEYRPHFELDIKKRKTLWRENICPRSRQYTRHPFLNSLANRKKWMEQESIVLDSRLLNEIRCLFDT